jgi:hypothetical protein
MPEGTPAPRQTCFLQDDLERSGDVIGAESMGERRSRTYQQTPHALPRFQQIIDGLNEYQNAQLGSGEVGPPLTFCYEDPSQYG